METLYVLGAVASLIGLVVALYTLYRVQRLPQALRGYARDQQLTDMVDEVLKVPRTKETLPENVARQVGQILRTVRLYYVSGWPWRQTQLKALLDQIDEELKGRQNTKMIQNQLRLVLSEIMIR